MCPGFGEVVVLINKKTRNLVYYCPACCTAWESIPEPDRIDQVLTLKEIAPDGVDVADENDIKRYKLERVAEKTDLYKELSDIL